MKTMTTWEAQRVANNLDRIDSYRNSGTTKYFAGDVTKTMTTWEAQRVANNLDRIDSYRTGIFAESQVFVGFLFGLPLFLMFIIYAFMSLI